MSAKGKTVLVTGATDGLGKVVATMLAKDGAAVLLHGRDRAKGESVLAEIKAAAGNPNLEFYLADLASLAEVRALGGAVKAKHPRLDVLVNNAGIGLFGGGGRQESRDGLELHFQVNYLAPFLLTELLLPALKASAPSRIVNVSSVGQAPIDFADVQLERSYSGVQGYCQSKLAQIMFTFDLAEKLKGSGVTVTSLHPGTFMNTNMVTGQGMTPQSRVEDGAAAVYRLVASPDVEGQTGVFYNQQTLGRANEQAYDAGARRKLWDLSAVLAGAGAD
jgi:NAD(P)-dependent dehydrogenase (short-subunit alcohol dehydrogenase family)